MDRLNAGAQMGGESTIGITNKYIDDILEGKDPFSVAEEEDKAQDPTQATKDPLRASPYVVEMTISDHAETYERWVQCDIIDKTAMSRLQTIYEDEELQHLKEGSEMFKQMSPGPSPDKLRRSTLKPGSTKEDAPETEEEKAEREKKELLDSFKILSAEDASQEMKKRDFEGFISKTGRIMERALDQEFDVIGDYLRDADDESAMLDK